MKKLFLFSLSCMAALAASAQWSTLSNKTADGGEMPKTVYRMALADGKLYAATPEGIWESASKNGGDWKLYGLSDKDVRFIDFSIDKLAITREKSTTGQTNKDGSTANTGFMYKLEGAAWNRLFEWNKGEMKGCEVSRNLVQLQDENGTIIYVVPTWGYGITRSEDGGKTWETSPFVYDDFNPDDPLNTNKTVPGVWHFEGDGSRLYGTGKASASDMYLLYSDDYGKTWSYYFTDNTINPWAVWKRTINGQTYIYYGGENGKDGCTVLRSDSDGAEDSWTPSATIDGTGAYWHNICMLSVGDSPVFVLLSHRGVFTYNDEDLKLEQFGEDIVASGEKDYFKHMLLDGNRMLVCGDGFIQTREVPNLGAVEGIIVDNDSEAPVEYFNMQGQRVSNPVSGLFIRKQGVKAEKVIL